MLPNFKVLDKRSDTKAAVLEKETMRKKQSRLYLAPA